MFDYEWYLKTHADYEPGTLEILNDFCNSYPNFSIIDPSTSWHQLMDEGIRTVLTCYGSVGRELPLLRF